MQDTEIVQGEQIEVSVLSDMPPLLSIVQWIKQADHEVQCGFRVDDSLRLVAAKALKEFQKQAALQEKDRVSLSQ